MNQLQAQQLVNKTFGNDFTAANFVEFISELTHGELNKASAFSPLPTDVQDNFRYKYHERIESYEKIGSYADTLDVLIVKLRRGVTLQRGRTTLREFSADYLVKGQGLGKSGVLAAFYAEDDYTWRFSYIKVDASLITDESGKLKKHIKKARRKGFLF